MQRDFEIQIAPTHKGCEENQVPERIQSGKLLSEARTSVDSRMSFEGCVEELHNSRNSLE